MASEELISVPALIEGGEVVVPSVELGRDLKCPPDLSIPALLHFVGYSDSLYPCPTLAELRHAFFGKNPDGSYVSPGYRESVFSLSNQVELTSTFLRDDGTLIESPERVHFDGKHGWIAEGGKETKVDWVNRGAVLDFDRPTGFPTRTTRSMKKYVEEMGHAPQSFVDLRPWKGVKYPGGIRPMRRGLVEVWRLNHCQSDPSPGISAPFCILAVYDPGIGYGLYRDVHRRGDCNGL